MSWLEWFGARPTMQSFARRFLRVLAAQGQQDWVINEAGDALSRDEATINLANLYLEYAGAARGERRALIDKYCAIATSIERKPPGLWTVAEPHLFPTVRSRFDRSAVDTQMRLGGHATMRAITWPLCADLHVRLVYDWGQHLAQLNQDQVDVWGQPLAALLESATRNLRALPAPRWTPLQAGLQQLESDASYAESFLLVERVRAALPFADHALYMPCNRGVLLAADSRDPRAVLAMVETAARYFDECPWAMSAAVLSHVAGEWASAQIDGDAALLVADLRARHLAETYAAQRSVLDQFDAADDSPYHAEFGLLRPAQGAPIRSWCSWAEGVPSTLPETDDVYLTRKSGSLEPTLLEVRWTDLVEICGELLARTPDEPARYLAPSFPDEAQWQQLRTRGRMLGDSG